MNWLQVIITEVINENCLNFIAAAEYNGSLNIEETLISNLDGIQHFTNLNYLSVKSNHALISIPDLLELTNLYFL